MQYDAVVAMLREEIATNKRTIAELQAQVQVQGQAANLVTDGGEAFTRRYKQATLRDVHCVYMPPLENVSPSIAALVRENYTCMSTTSILCPVDIFMFQDSAGKLTHAKSWTVVDPARINSHVRHEFPHYHSPSGLRRRDSSDSAYPREAIVDTMTVFDPRAWARPTAHQMDLCAERWAEDQAVRHGEAEGEDDRVTAISSNSDLHLNFVVPVKISLWATTP